MKRRYKSVVEMVRDTCDDPNFADELEAQIEARFEEKFWELFDLMLWFDYRRARN